MIPQDRLASLEATIAQLRRENDDLRTQNEEMIVPEPEQQTLLTHPHARFTPQERAMLGYLLKHEGRTVARHGIMAAATSTFKDRAEGPEEKIIDVKMHKIRQKLDLLRRLGVENVPVIETVRGVGYCARLATTTNKER